jgi:hypothetical protein
LNSAFSFNGVDSYIEMAKPVTGTNSFSFSMWIARPAAATEQTLLFQGNTTNDYDFGVWLSSRTVGPQVAFGVKNCTTLEYLLQEELTNEWVHIVGVADAWRHQFELWVNGVLVTRYPWVGNGTLQNRYPLYVGRGTDPLNGWNYFNGKMDDVRFFDRALTPEEVKRLRMEIRIERIVSPVAATPPDSTVAVSFEADAGAIYVLEASSGFQNWTEMYRIVGQGKRTSALVPILGEGDFLRVRRVD